MYQTLPGSELVVRTTDGALIPADPGNADRQAFLAWLGAGNTPEPAAPPPPIPPLRVLTALAFMERFTAAERRAIRTAARAPGGEALEDWLDLLRAAQQVDLDDPRTAAGLVALVGAGLISEARRAKILRVSAGQGATP